MSVIEEARDIAPYMLSSDPYIPIRKVDLRADACES